MGGSLLHYFKFDSMRSEEMLHSRPTNGLDFKVVLQPEADGGCSVSCPALPGCHSQADSLDEARANIKEAIEPTLKDARADGGA